MEIVATTANDFPKIWKAIEPTVRAGDSFALPRDYSEEQTRAWWTSNPHTFAAFDGERCLGAYFFRANQLGAGSHVANAAYVVAPDTRGRGVAKALCRHSLDEARKASFRAMQFNIVVSTNETAIRAWRACGFDIVGTLPGAFNHPALGYVDAHIMFRTL